MSEEEASPAPEDPGRATVIGPGRIGLTLAEGLHSAATHRTVQVVGRERRAPAFLADRPGISYRRADDWTPPAGGGALELFFAVPDRALVETVRAWAGRLDGTGDEAAGAFHTSGSHPPDVLRPLGERGAEVAVLHPLRAVPAPEIGGFAGAWFGTAGSAGGRRRARALASALGARALEIRDGDSGRYHAAAVLASNLLTGCLLLARRELAAATDASPGEAREALDELARSALEAARREGGETGLTGPLARGDVETVARHLSALDSPVREAYAGLTRALAHGVLEMDPAVRAPLEELLVSAVRDGGDARTGDEEGEG